MRTVRDPSVPVSNEPGASRAASIPGFKPPVPERPANA
jgi:hypothetical protein